MCKDQVIAIIEQSIQVVFIHVSKACCSNIIIIIMHVGIILLRKKHKNFKQKSALCNSIIKKK